MSWNTLLPLPIPVPSGKVTLRGAGMPIRKLPKAKAETPAWRAATEALVHSNERRGPLMHAEVGPQKTLHPAERVFCPKRKHPRRMPARDG
jgi:hypothetical protein